MRYVLVLLALSTLACGPDPAYVEAVNVACSKQRECSLAGQCGYSTVGGQHGREIAPGVFISQCSPTTDAHCAGSDACKVGGSCAADGGVCRARDNEGCLKSSGCRSFGYCTAIEGSCRPGSDDDCKRSDACALAGSCRVLGKRCVK